MINIIPRGANKTSELTKDEMALRALEFLGMGINLDVEGKVP